jgi:hypothetical protein
MEIDKLVEYVKARIENLTNLTVYNKKSPTTNKVYPNVVFRFYTNSYLVRHRKDWILEIDYWNDTPDDSDIIQAAIDIKNGRTVDEVDYIGLNNSTQDETEGFYKCYIDFESDIPDPEPYISHYHQRYIVQVD